MTNRERFQAVLHFEPVDRLPVLEWASWWDQTLRRWRTEGLPAELNRYAICEHLGLDLLVQDWVRARGPDCPKPASHGAGIITNEEDYERIRPYLFPENPINRKRWQAWAARQAAGEIAIWFTLDGFFWFPRTLFGIEGHLFAFYDYPELMQRMNSDLAAWHLRVIDEIFSICVPDFMTFAEDLSYNHGPMLSEEQFETFLAPYYRRVVPRLVDAGCIPFVDTDGDITAAIPWFERVGVQGFLPLERMAGINVTQIRQDHPRLRLLGAFDKTVMHKGEAAIRAEFERLLPVASGGGFLMSCDHQTPPGVALEDYKLYVRLFHEYAIKAAQQKHAP